MAVGHVVVHYDRAVQVFSAGIKCRHCIWVPSINKAVLRVCALYAASCSGISPGGLKRFLYVPCLLGEEGRVSTSVDTRL